MAEITAKTVMALREKTNAAMMECKSALKEADGDLEKAEIIRRKKGSITAEKKADRQTKEGIISSYIHMAGRIGVLIEVNCETDFVARNDIFQAFVKDLSLHIAAANPKFLGREEIPESLIAKERDIALDQVKGTPEAIAEKIVDGRVKKFYSEICLLEQPFIKDDKKKIQDLLNELIGVLGENMQIGRFTRMVLGEEAETDAAEE